MCRPQVRGASDAGQGLSENGQGRQESSGAGNGGRRRSRRSSSGSCNVVAAAAAAAAAAADVLLFLSVFLLHWPPQALSESRDGDQEHAVDQGLVLWSE